MARIKQMAKQMGVSVDKADELADRAQAKAIAASYEKGGIIRGTRAQVRGRRFSGVY